MEHSWVVLAVALAYLVASLLIGLFGGRKASDSAAGFVAGDRTLGTVLMFFITGATIFSAFAFLGAPGRAYSTGVAVIWILVYGTFGFLPFYWLGPRAARVGRELGFVTQAELVAHRFRSPTLAVLMALVSVLAFLPYLALQMQGAGHVLSVVSGGAVSVEMGAGLVYLVVLLYVAKSGVLGVGWTNMFQGMFMLVLAWALGIYLPHALYGGVRPMFESIASERPELLSLPGLTTGGSAWTWSGWTSTILVTAAGFSFWPHLFMKAFTAKSVRVLQRTVALYPIFQVFLVPILLIGFAAILYPDPPSTPDEALPHILVGMQLPALVVGLFCAGALAASMSSGDAILHASASILVRDGYVAGMRQELTPHRERRAIRWLLLPILVVAYWIGIVHGDDLVGLLVYAYGPIGQLGPVVVAALCWRRASRMGVLAGLLGGITVTLLLSWRPAWAPWDLHAGAYGLVVNGVLLFLVSLALPDPDPEHADAFLATARGG